MYNKGNFPVLLLLSFLTLTSPLIFPEKLSTWDPILTSNTNSIFLVQAVYYTTSTTSSFYLNKQGIVVKPSQDVLFLCNIVWTTEFGEYYLLI
jgi:hypothetical protein